MKSLELKSNNQKELHGYKNTFLDIVKLYNQKKLPNKIIFSGPKGIGKATFAYHLINYIFSKDEECNYDIDNLQIIDSTHPIIKDLPEGAHTYFVHSYHFVTKDQRHVLATVNYGKPLTAIVGRDNMIGTQFHPEKSQRTGLRIIRNFLDWRP